MENGGNIIALIWNLKKKFIAVFQNSILKNFPGTSASDIYYSTDWGEKAILPNLRYSDPADSIYCTSAHSSYCKLYNILKTQVYIKCWI